MRRCPSVFDALYKMQRRDFILASPGCPAAWYGSPTGLDRTMMADKRKALWTRNHQLFISLLIQPNNRNNNRKRSDSVINISNNINLAERYSAAAPIVVCALGQLRRVNALSGDAVLRLNGILVRWNWRMHRLWFERIQ